MPYRLAATETVDGEPAGELHAYLAGVETTLCGRLLMEDVFIFVGWNWDDRPAGLPVCEICTAWTRPAPAS